MSDLMAVCCGEPLIWTFCFSSSEWYCRVCKQDFPMFNVERKTTTQELEKKKIENEAWFHDISKDYIPYRAFKKDCTLCNSTEPHWNHATEEEKEKSKKAYLILKN